MSGIQAVRVAAYLRRVLNTDVQMIKGGFGEFKVLVDNEVVVDAGALAMLGVLPTRRQVLSVVQERLKGDAS